MKLFRKTITLLLEELVLCVACMVPGYLVLDYFGSNPFSSLPLFWGGMLYKHFLDKFINERK